MPQLIDVVEIKSGKIKQVGEWALKDPKQLASLGLKLADEKQAQALSDAESISDAVKKKLSDAAAAKKIAEEKPKDAHVDQDFEVEHELVNPLDDYENINEAETVLPALVDAHEIPQAEEVIENTELPEDETPLPAEEKVEKKRAGRPAKAK